MSSSALGVAPTNLLVPLARATLLRESGVFCEEANCGFELPPDLLATLGALDLPLDLDIYPYPEVDETLPGAAGGDGATGGDAERCG